MDMILPHTLSLEITKNNSFVQKKMKSLQIQGSVKEVRELESCRKCHDDVVIVSVNQTFNFWKVPKNVTPEMERL
jgi:hypothetical protein